MLSRITNAARCLPQKSAGGDRPRTTGQRARNWIALTRDHNRFTTGYIFVNRGPSMRTA